MKKAVKAISVVLSVVMIASAFASCGSSVAPNAVFGIDDINGKKIGVQQGTTGDLYVSDKDEYPDTDVVRYKSGNEAVQSLLQGKVDAVVIDNEPAKVFVASNSEKLKILDEPFADEEYALCFAKDKAELKNQVNGALKQLIADGTIQSIIDNYIGDNQGKTPYKSPSNVDRSKGKLVMATNAQFPPYEYYESDKIVGIDADIAQAICDVLGMELKIEDMEFDAIISAVQSGKADFGAAGMTINEDRLKSVDFTDTYVTAKQVIIVRSK